MAALIQLRNLAKIYQSGDSEFAALHDVNLSIERGEFVAITGSSGSGKSTLMNLLGCLDSPSRGSYLLADRDVAKLSRIELAKVRNEFIGFVFQNFNLLSRTSAAENVELPLIYARVPPAERHKRAREALERVGLGHRAGHTPSQLSGGQQQRVAIARALVTRPPLILADEPTGNLDSATSVDIMKLLTELQGSGMTIVFVTHEMDIAAYAARKLLLKDGAVISDVRQQPTAGGGLMISIGETLRLAGRALRRNTLRSFLTTLGIIIGVGAVIFIQSIGEGAKSRVRAQIESAGTNIVMLFSGTESGSGRPRWRGLAAQHHLGRPARHPDRAALGACRGAADQQRPAGDFRDQYLEHADHRHHARLLHHPQLAGGRWRVVHCVRPGQRREECGHRADRGREPVRAGRRSHRADRAHP